jgi:hypothetical protein
MKQTFRIRFISIALIGAYLLSACGGALPQVAPSEVAQKVQTREIVFTGAVEQISGDQWVVSGQAFTVAPTASMDSSIAVGDIVKVEGQVSADGVVTALKVETSMATDDNANDGNVNGNTNDDASGSGSNANDNANTNANTNADNSNSANDNGSAGGTGGPEVFGLVEAITTESITVNGVTYQFATFTEFKDAIAVGDQVKIHVIVNSDGTFSIREIEKSDGLGDDGNSNDDNGNDDNSNGGNSNDDDGNDDNSNGGNSNDDGGGGGDDDDDDDDDDDNGNDD